MAGLLHLRVARFCSGLGSVEGRYYPQTGPEVDHCLRMGSLI